MQGDNVKGLSLGNDEWMDDGIIVYIAGCPTFLAWELPFEKTIWSDLPTLKISKYIY